MRNWISITSLLFLLCGLAFSSAGQEDSAVARLGGVTFDMLSKALEVRDPKGGGGRGGGGHGRSGKSGGKSGKGDIGGINDGNDDDEDDQESDDDPRRYDLAYCNNGTDCVDCFGEGFTHCPYPPGRCYNTNNATTFEVCQEDPRPKNNNGKIPSSASAFLSGGQGWSILTTMAMVALMMVMIL